MNEQKFLNIIHRNTFMRGELEMPCLPSLIDLYMDRLKTLFDTFGKSFSPDELDHLRLLLINKLVEGFRISPLTKLVFRYEPSQSPNTGITYTITYAIGSITDQYHNWATTKEPPLFGSHPDAKVMEVLAQMGEAHQLKVLDIGAGTGRNTLPISRLGAHVDALEMTPTFVQQLQNLAQTENLQISVIAGDILDPLIRLQTFCYNFVISAEVTSHFRDSNQLRLLLAKTCDYLQCGGMLLFNIFITNEGYNPEPLDREMSEIAWSTFFTYQDLNSALENLPLEIVSNDSVLEFERDRLPPEAWPPTGWFESWASGRDVFPLEQNPPIQLRWILCKRN